MKVLCIKNFEMSSGRVAFTKGKVYEFKRSGKFGSYNTKSEISTSHSMHKSHIGSEWFTELEHTIDEYIKKELFEI